MKIDDKIVNDKNIKLIIKLHQIKKAFSANCIDELIINENDYLPDEGERKKYFGIFGSLVDNFLKVFYQNNIFPSGKYIYDIFFYHIKENISKEIKNEDAKDILNRTLEDVDKFNLISNSLIIHPLADFGFQGIGGNIYFTKDVKQFYFKTDQFLIFPQANSIENVYKNIEISMKYFKLASTKLQKDLFDHYQKSRDTKWLINNPIIIHMIKQSYDDYYENRFYITKQLEKHLSILYLTKCLSENTKLSKRNVFSTNNTNNFQTYNEYHYFILRKNKRKLIPECIPKLSKMSRIFDTFKLNITMPLNMEKSDRKKITEIEKFLNSIYTELYSDKENHNLQVVRRSIGYFVRSYQAEYNEDKVLFLCIAFEMLLSEKVTEDISAHIGNIILMLTNGNEEDAKNFKNLYNARSGVAHEGVARECDLKYCQYLYFRIIHAITKLSTKDLNLKSPNCYTEMINSIILKKIGHKVKIK